MSKRGRVVLGMACFLAAAVTAWAVEAESTKAVEKGAKASDKGWLQLFNGKDLKGWKAEGGADWKVENGLLVGRQGQPGNKPGDLFTEKSFDNFELVVTWKAAWPCNTGVWFRYQKPDLAYQADILEWPDPVAFTGTLYSPNLPKGQLFLAINADKALEKRDDWNTFRITAVGDRLSVVLNGKKTADVRDKRSDRGKIGFQVHPGDQFAKMAVMIKECSLRPLAPPKGGEKAASK